MMNDLFSFIELENDVENYEKFDKNHIVKTNNEK